MISVIILAKNEAACIEQCINSVKEFVSEIIVGDDASEDNTIELARSLGARVIPLKESVASQGFASAVNWLIRQAREDWILIIDADEIMEEVRYLNNLIQEDIFVWALPRRKWTDWSSKIREEYEAYPDWQVKFFRSGRSFRYFGKMHVQYQTSDRVHFAFRGPHIEHLQKENRSIDKVIHRETLYNNLAKAQGVQIVGGDPIRII